MSEDRETLPPRPKPEEKSKGRLLDWLDAIAKLVGAAAVLAVALIANSFQGRLTGVSIQSQREQAESQSACEHVQQPNWSDRGTANERQGALPRPRATDRATFGSQFQREF